MWTNTCNSGRSTRASTTQPKLPENPTREEWNTYLNSLWCSVTPAAEEVIRLILDYPSQGWCPLVDYLKDGRESLSSRCGFDEHKLMECRNMLFGTLDMKTMLKETFCISAEAVYNNYWFVHFNRGSPLQKSFAAAPIVPAAVGTEGLALARRVGFGRLGKGRSSSTSLTIC